MDKTQNIEELVHWRIKIRIFTHEVHVNGRVNVIGTLYAKIILKC